jgi:hypothetical protein
MSRVYGTISELSKIVTNTLSSALMLISPILRKTYFDLIVSFAAVVIETTLPN